MESTSFKVVSKIAQAYDHQLRADDPRFRRDVTLIHEDGSYIHFDSAFLLRVRDSWIVAFTEHHGLHIYNDDDLLSYWESERRREPIQSMSDGH